MPQENTLDPAVILAQLEAKKTALEALIASWRAAIAVGALGPVTDLPAASEATGSHAVDAVVELPQGALRNRTLPEAIKLFLSAAKTKQTIKQVAAALKEGGIESTSDNFEGVVTGSLNRLKDRGEVLRFKDGWALAAHYPESLRARINDTAQKSKPKKKQGKRAGKKRVQSDETPGAKAAAETKGTQESILKLLKSKPTSEFSAKDVSEQLSMRIQTAHFLLGKLVYTKQAERTPAGNFRAIAA